MRDARSKLLDVPINETVFWTDSMELFGIPRLQTFVANRLTVNHEGFLPDSENSTKRN